MQVEKKIPFIPMEQEIDALIAGSNKKLAAFLQLLKETAISLEKPSTYYGQT